MTTREPEWTDQDRTEVLALDLYRASLCSGGCGQPVAESTSHYEAGPAYEAKSTTCRACAELQESQRGKAKSADAGARLWHVVKSRG